MKKDFFTLIKDGPSITKALRRRMIVMGDIIYKKKINHKFIR
jgi:choline kinase